MGRSQSAQISKQAQANSTQDQANAESALGATNDALKQYSTNLNNFMKFGRDTYGQNGEFARDENTIANTTAAAGSRATAADLALNAQRTGANTAGYAGTVASARRQGQQDLTSQLAGADATRLQNLTNINQYGVQASALPAQVQSSLYGTSLSGGNSALGTSAQASAASPGFMDVFGQDLAQVAQGAGSAIGGAL